MKTSERRQVILDWLGIEECDLCLKCRGRGRRLYGSTATWRGGIGGQMITLDVCDACWGTGRNDKQGANLKLMSNEVVRLRELCRRHGIDHER